MFPYQIIDPKKNKDNLEYLYIYIQDDFEYEIPVKKKDDNDKPERGSIVIDIF
jgi:hypothetical protein